jgi:hypothetical protein
MVVRSESHMEPDSATKVVSDVPRLCKKECRGAQTSVIVDALKLLARVSETSTQLCYQANVSSHLSLSLTLLMKARLSTWMTTSHLGSRHLHGGLVYRLEDSTLPGIVALVESQFLYRHLSKKHIRLLTIESLIDMVYADWILRTCAAKRPAMTHYRTAGDKSCHRDQYFAAEIQR